MASDCTSEQSEERRPCPACGYEMPKGTTQCGYCGYSAFAVAAAPTWAVAGTAGASGQALTHAPGFYPDPTGTAAFRWCDGTWWTEHLRHHAE